MKEIEIALKNYFKALNDLRILGVIKNKKDFTGQIGEWLIEAVYNGKRAESGINKGWDIKIAEKCIQVKTHSKSGKNKNRWSPLECPDNIQIDELFIVVFTEEYKLKEIYKVPWTKAIEYSKERGKKRKRREVNWSSLMKYKIDVSKLPNQEIVKIFS